MRAIRRMLLLMKAVLWFAALVVISSPMTVLVTCVGVFWIYDGIGRGMKYYELVGQRPVKMAVMQVENRNHRRFFPDYVALGTVSNSSSTITVSIFRNQYRRLRHGSSLEVYPLSSGGWLNHARLEESMPIFSILGLHFSWQFLAGIFMLAAWFGLRPYLSRKRKATTGPAGGPGSEGKSTGSQTNDGSRS